MAEDLVLVTGGSGFIGVHCILQLLEAGYRVRTTVRSAKREADVRAMLKVGGVDPAQKLSFVIADLSADAGWSDAVRGCAYVLHVASPFPGAPPKHEDDLIVPAREGALRVLRASRDAGVKRVVMTSSFAAIGYGHKQQDEPFDETSWTNINSRDGVSAYAKSKTLAERAAWDFIEKEGAPLELAVINPVGVFGPVLGPDFSTSIMIIQRLLKGDVPGCPRISFGIVDVRDVAALHLAAMTDPAAKGQRFLAASGEVWAFTEIARTLKAHLGAAASKVKTREIPDWLLRIVALWDRSVGLILPELGKVKRLNVAKAKRVFHWTPRSNEESVLATAESLLQLGLVGTDKTRSSALQSHPSSR